MGSNIINVLLNVVLIARYGAVGAAWSMIITTVTIFVVSQFLLRRQIGVDLGRFVGRLLEFYPMAIKEAYRFILRKKVNA
jgi:Na+-driven multidrug efflux pump